MIPKYPDESIQSIVSPDPSWWVDSQTLARGSLVWAIVPYPEQSHFASFRSDGDRMRGSTPARNFVSDAMITKEIMLATVSFYQLPSFCSPNGIHKAR